MSRPAAFKLLVQLLLIVGVACPTVWSRPPPSFTLDIPGSFDTSVTVKQYQKGEDILNSPPFRLTTVAPMREYRGWWGLITHQQADDHSWIVRVYRRNSPRVFAAYATAKNGFKADLNEEPEFLGLGERSYMFARFERKHFRWGNAVSFFSQFSQDPVVYVPHNGHLTYEVWGVTPDHQYTVVAHIAVSHPKLGDWGPDVRHAGSIEELKKDRDYKLVEKCSPEEFEPSLTAFDRLVDSIKIE
jgi:hypothetical protein